MAEEACAPTSRMRSLAKCFEELSSANAPQTKPKAGEENPSYSKPAEMLPPRESRLNVREQRKEAIFTSSTLDFVALSACGDLSEFSGGDLSLPLPDCGESAQQSTMRAPACDTQEGPQQGRKRRYSQESLAEEMEMLASYPASYPSSYPASYPCSHRGEAGPTKQARQRVQRISSETLTLEGIFSAAPEEGGPCKNAPRTTSHMSHNSTHSIAGKTSSSNDDQASDEVGGFELNMTKLLRQMEGGPTHPRSESRLDNRSESSMSIISQNQNQKERRTPLPLHLRNNGSTAGTVGPTPSIKDLEDGRSRAGSRQGEDGIGRFSRMSRQDSIGSSLSGWCGAPGASNFAVVTPPSAPDAFQAHELLVKCPAPKRPVACSRVNAPFSRPMNRTLEVGRSIEAQGATLSRPRGGLPRAPSRSSLSVLEASYTADDLVALRRNGSRVSLQRIPSEVMLQRLPASAEVSSAEDLAQRALHFGVA